MTNLKKERVIQVKKSILKKVYKFRGEHSIKNDFGNLLIIGGNKKYSGSLAFNALSAISAYKSGVDIVEIIAPKRAADIIAKFSPNMITYPFNGDFIKKNHLSILFKESKNKKAFIIGGGIGKNKKTLFAIKNYLEKIKIPGVIDADAIYAITKNNIKDKKIKLKNFVFTPHSHEFFVLTGKKIHHKINLKEKINLVRQEAKNFDTTILLKGNPDIISNGDQTAINKTGNAYMTVGGTGDTLAGILGGLIAQGNDLFESACAAAYINGKAGELASKNLKVSMTATDLLEKISQVIS